MKKVIVSAIIVVLIGVAFIAFNLYATRKAEDQINKFIQLQVNVPGSLVNIDYSAAKVPAFSGNIYFSNVTLHGFGWSVKIDHLKVQLGYFKLFRFFISKTKKALKHTHSVEIHAKQIQFETKNKANFSIASVAMHQEGNLWEATKSALLHIPLQQQQSLEFRAAQLRYHEPESNIGIIKSDSAYFHYIIPGIATTTSVKQDSLLISDLTWVLPAPLKNRFGLFLAGFGFSSDSIQVARAGFAFSSLNQQRIHLKNGIFQTDPLTVSFSGTILKRRPWGSSKLAPINLQVEHISDNLRNLLTGFGFLKQGKQQNQGELSFRLIGPIRSPHLEK